MYLRTLKAARSAKFFWEEIFMPKSQLGGILYIFPPGSLFYKLSSKGPNRAKTLNRHKLHFLLLRVIVYICIYFKCKGRAILRGGGGGFGPIILGHLILRYTLKAKARTHPEIFRVVLGPCVQFCPCEASEQKMGPKTKIYTLGDRALKLSSFDSSQKKQAI